jgi:hypothetical protein
MCVAQQGDRLPPLDAEIDPILSSGISTCMPGGVVFRGIVSGEMAQGGMCDMVRSIMEEATHALMGGP